MIRKGKELAKKGADSDSIIAQMRGALEIAEGVIVWALDHGAAKDSVGAILKQIRKVLTQSRRRKKVPAKPRTKDNGVYSYLDASTGHITESDMRLLDCKGRPRIENGIISVPHQYGAWIHCLTDQGFTENDYENVRAGGFSDSFIKLLKFAKQRNCEWINLDQDGFIHGDRKLDCNEW